MSNSSVQFVLILGALLVGNCARFWCWLCLQIPVPRTIAMLSSAFRQLLPRLCLLMLCVPLNGAELLVKCFK